MDLAKLKQLIVDNGMADLPHEDIAKRLNERTREVDTESINGGSLAGAIDPGESAQLDAHQKWWLALLVSASTPIPLVQNVRVALRDMFPSGSETRKNIRKALRREGSILDEAGFVGTPDTSAVANALLREGE